MGATIHAGRDFNAADRRDSPEVAIVNDAFVRRVLTGGNAIGVRVIVGRDGGGISIVGVVSDIGHDFRIRAAPVPEIYFPYAQQTRWATYIVVRSENLAVTL